MSKRLRLETEKLKQLDQELKLEEDKIKQQKERIYAPIVWKRLGSGIKIQDMKPNYFEDALRIMQEYFIIEDVLCRNSNLKDDPVSVASLANRTLFYMKDGTSLIALDERTVRSAEEDRLNRKMRLSLTLMAFSNKDAIAGCAICKVSHKSDFSSVFNRVQVVEGEPFKKCLAFLSNLSRKANVYETFNCESFLNFYSICVTPEYRKRGLGYQMLLAGVDVARSLGLSVISGIFPCHSLQKLAKRIGMKVVYEVKYINWKDKYGEMIFDEPGVGNYTCAVMAGEIPPAPSVDPAFAKLNEEEVPAKMTREDKRKAKEKAASKKK